MSRTNGPIPYSDTGRENHDRIFGGVPPHLAKCVNCTKPCSECPEPYVHHEHDEDEVPVFEEFVPTGGYFTIGDNLLTEALQKALNEELDDAFDKAMKAICDSFKDNCKHRHVTALTNGKLRCCTCGHTAEQIGNVCVSKPTVFGRYIDGKYVPAENRTLPPIKLMRSDEYHDLMQQYEGEPQQENAWQHPEDTI